MVTMTMMLLLLFWSNHKLRQCVL